MIKKIGAALLLLIAGVLGFAAVQSPDYTISREITINAPAEKIYPFLNSSQLAENWAPWPEVDPEAKMGYSGPESGPGNRTTWESKGQLGTGSATIVESVPNQKVAIKLEYTKPIEMTQDSEYLIKSSGNESVVTWVVRGKNSFPGRVMCLFINMDKMVGGMFEKGLAKLKAVVEKQG